MVALTRQSATAEALSRLAATLDTLELGADAGSIAGERDHLVGTMRSFLIPRALDPDAPMTVVIAGPTGSGKSTLLNSLVGADVSPTGVRRPTTTAPVVVAAPEHVADYEIVGGVRCRTHQLHDPVLRTLVLVDSPDIDSTSTWHREMAENLIDSADVVVFVTSALRYADDVPWQVLRRAQSRGAPVIHLLNRVESQSSGAPVDFRSRLSSVGVGTDLIVVPEHHVPQGAHRIPKVSVEGLRDRLADLTSNRDELAGDVFLRVLSTTLTHVIGLTDHLIRIRDEIDGLENMWSSRLNRRVAGLALGGVADGLALAVPKRTSRGSLRRWQKKSLLSASDIEAAEANVIGRIVTVVISDVRRWLVESRTELTEHALGSVPVIEAMMPAAGTAVAGWIDYVARIAVDFDERHAWLGEAVLIDAASRGEFTPGMKALFGESGPVLVDRARRELTGRLEVVYEHVARLLADALRDRYAEPDETELRAAVGAVTATIAPLHA